jgi:16S rRNA (cytosine967-C5)-methyltransferase
VASIAFGGSSSEDALRPYEEARERAAVKAITLGSIRWFLRLASALEPLLSRPQTLAEEVRALLVVSAHQIEYSRNVPQATVHAAVDATRLLKHARASSLLNAVLRRFVAERVGLLEHADRSLETRTAHPSWLVQSLRRSWPAELEQILEANNVHPPLVLRVDLSRRSAADYVGELAGAGLQGHAMGWTPAAVWLERPVSVHTLPLFREGVVSVQDAGAQLAAGLLDVQPGMRVLDACAAPGGKTGHLAESAPEASELVAVEVDEARLGRVRENLERLRRRATLLRGDLREPATFWDGRPFERILVDAPCSSTGVIRRHPDIKLLRRSSDIPQFAATQLEILRGAFRLLAPGGRLVYSTCSLLPEENEEVVSRLLIAESSARVALMPAADRLAPGATARPVGIQLLPGAQAATDGFYYACLEKTTAGT